MKRINIQSIMLLCLSIWLILVISSIFKVIKPELISKFSAQAEIIFNIFTAFIIFTIYTKSYDVNKRIMFYLLMASVGIFLNDATFYFIAYFSDNYIMNLPFVGLIVDMVTYAIWIIFIAAFLSRVLIQDIFKAHHMVKIMISLLVINIIIMTLYLSSIHYAFGALSWQSIVQIMSTVAELIIFDLAILTIIYSNNIGLSSILAGLILLISGDCLINYSYITQTNTVEAQGELLWFLGVLVIFFGSLLLKQHQEYIAKNWLRKANAIKSKLAMWAFGISIISVMPLFLWIYFLFPHSKNIFLIFLPLTMITSVLAVIIALITGNNFEKPFEKVARNIKRIMLNGDRKDLTDDFTINEFVFLQEFIYDVHNIKEERDSARKAYGELAAQVAHDIRSPIAAILMLTKESIDLPEEPRVMLRDAAHRIQEITNNLMDRSRESTDEDINTNRLFLVSTAILSAIAEKKIEYKNSKLEIVHQFDGDSVFCFIYANLTEFKRVLSNLLNNAIEAMNAIGIVTLKLSCTTDIVNVEIIDSGGGMSQADVDAIMSGEMISNKLAGLGLGLRHARAFLQGCEAKLNIASTSTYGTTISLLFKKPQNESCWIAHEIKCFSYSIVVILDDDASIHAAWDKLLEAFFKKVGITLQVIHFIKGIDCLEFLKQFNASQADGIILLADYELIKQDLNGLDVIEQAKIHQAVLVTSYDENKDIIRRSMLLNTQILPKLLIAEVKLELVEPTSLKETGADLVVVEDNKAFSEVISYLYEYRGKSLDTYHEPYALFENLYRYDKLKTKFCLDFDLGGMVNGIELAGALHKRGFTQLYLASGYQFEAAEIPPYLQVLTNKMALLSL